MCRILQTKILIFLILSSILSVNFYGCQKQNKDAVSLSYLCFDTAVTITIYSQNGKKESKEIIQECFKKCSDYEQLFSRTIKDSDIGKINNSNGNAVVIHDDTSKIINKSIKYSRLSDGAFDITVAPLVNLWNIRQGNINIPKEKEIQTAKKLINYKTIQTKGNTIQLVNPKAQIDLGGIAKGYVADKLKDYMISEGVTSAIIDLGGNILAIGGKSPNENFTIGIRQPFSQNNTYAATIDIKDCSVVTSGTYQRYFKSNGKIYHHILDVFTGYPVDNGLTSVTIISPKSFDGDALSTTVFALGIDKGKKLIASMDEIEAVFITENGTILLSEGLTIDKNNKIHFNTSDNQ